MMDLIEVLSILSKAAVILAALAAVVFVRAHAWEHKHDKVSRIWTIIGIAYILFFGGSMLWLSWQITES
ncbi:MAG: hypothetical protein ACI3XZ_01945 [Butyricicoccus sp.]